MWTISIVTEERQSNINISLDARAKVLALCSICGGICLAANCQFVSYKQPQVRVPLHPFPHGGTAFIKTTESDSPKDGKMHTSGFILGGKAPPLQYTCTTDKLLDDIDRPLWHTSGSGKEGSPVF